MMTGRVAMVIAVALSLRCDGIHGITASSPRDLPPRDRLDHGHRLLAANGHERRTVCPIRQLFDFESRVSRDVSKVC
jgi:hypothetical protein